MLTTQGEAASDVREELIELLRALRQDPESAELVQEYREALTYSRESIVFPNDTARDNFEHVRDSLL
jgi:hypothetical protein